MIFICQQYLYNTSNTMESDIVLQQIQALKTANPSTNQSQILENLSFHEYNYQNTSKNYHKFLNNIKTCHLKATDKSKVTQKLINDSKINYNSIFAFGDSICKFLQNSLKNNQGVENLAISHAHYISEAAILAYYLRRQGHSIRLLSSNKQVNRGWTASLVNKNETDKLSQFYQILRDQGIGLTFFEEKQDKIQLKDKKDVITIVDIFNLHPTIYRPYIFNELKIDNRVILYGSQIQFQEIKNLISVSPTQTQFQILQLSDKFPIQISSKRRVQDELVSFLTEQSFNPNKQDIIIFHNQQDKYLSTLTHILKKQNSDFLKQVNIITEANQSQKIGVIQGAGDSKIMHSGLSKKNQNNKLQPIPQQIFSTNNIFIVPNYDTLISWNYDLSRVFYVFDFMKDQTFSFDYAYMTYIQKTYNYISLRENLARMSLVGVNRIGKYCSSYNGENEDENENNWFLEDNKVKDIAPYILKMLNNPINSQHFQKQIQNSKIKQSLKALVTAKIVQKRGDKYQILRNDILEALQQLPDLNPIYLSLIIDYKNGLYTQQPSQEDQNKYKKMGQLITYAVSIISTPDNLRLISQATKQNNVSDRPTALWRQTGYLHSAIDAIVRYKIIQNKNNKMSLHPNMSHRVTSKKNLSRITSQEYDIFGNLFEIIQPKKITFDEMGLEDLIREQLINEPVLHKILDQIDKISQVLQLDQFEFVKFQQINDVIEALCSKTDRGYGVYSGSRRIGYIIKDSNQGIFPSKTSLIHLLNERPLFILILRIAESISIDGQKKIQIQSCNHLNQIMFMEIFGQLPAHKKSSYGQHQLEFHGISSATFSMLWRNDGSDIKSFQQKYQCLVQFNQELALITIHCIKQQSRIINEQFQKLLEKTKNDLVASTKIVNYFGNTSVILGTGGSVLQVVKDSFINKCLLDNLNIYVEQSDLYELFEEFFTIKSISINQPDQSSKSFYKSAVIQFVSQKDYYRFYEYYNQCLYMQRYLRVSPIQSKPQKTTLVQQMYIQFSWSVWKSQGKAMVEYAGEQSARKCVEMMNNNKKIDKKLVKAKQVQRKVYFEQLNQNTDEMILEAAIGNFGKINNIEMMKVPVKQHQNHEDNLISEIKKLFEQQIFFEVTPIKKQKNGLRKCNVIFKNINHVNTVLQELNKKMGIVGVGRVHLTSWFTNPVIISKGYANLYEQLINDALKKMPNNHCIKIQHIVFHQNQYILTKSTKKQEIDVFKQQVNSVLTGYPVELSSFQANIVLTQIGIQNLLQIEQKYGCKLLPNIKEKILLVLTRFSSLTRIKQEIKARVNDNFFYRIPLNRRAFKHFKQNESIYKQMEKRYNLNLIELEEVGRNILVQGNANHIQNALTYLTHTIQSVSKEMQQMINADCCGICCQQPFRPYRLQKCGHQFCMQCLIDNISSTLGDISMFPIKCPQCLAELVIQDLNRLLDNNLWPRLISMAVNQYVGKNSDFITNCYTAGCKQINFIVSQYFKCDSCVQSYCMQCKMNYHPGMTCQQARQGGNAAFEKYMKENGIRRCPYDKCKMPIQRIDGCYRVTCSRCGKSMCFKCQPQQMIAYDNYNDCYKHLSQVHGGYF